MLIEQFLAELGVVNKYTITEHLDAWLDEDARFNSFKKGINEPVTKLVFRCIEDTQRAWVIMANK